jgi:glycosyltransferase involved in cell wall biosynthesis
MLYVSHQTGNRNVRGILGAAFDADWLGRFFVTLDLGGLVRFSKVLPVGLMNELQRRVFAGIPADLIASHGATEALAIVTERLPLTRNLGLTKRYRAVGFLKSHDRWAAARLGALPARSAVYAYPCGALSTFQRARAAGATTVLEFTQAHWSFAASILEEEAQINPAWRFALPEPAALRERAKREDAELDLADAVVCPSRFVLRTLPHTPRHTLVAGYGCPAPTERRARVSAPSQPLKVLFVGALSQQKGLSYLFDAMSMMGPAAELTIVGSAGEYDGPRLREAIGRSRWHPSLPNAAVRALMREHDVLVLPSLSEAYGLVVGEALSEGAPVIVSENVGAADLVEHGRNGFVVPIRDGEAIAAALTLMLDRDRLAMMSAAAYETAESAPESTVWRETLSWVRSIVDAPNADGGLVGSSVGP